MVVQLVLKSQNCTLFRILHSYPEVKRLSQILYHYWTIPLSRPWTPAVRDFALVMCTPHAIVHIIICAPPPPISKSWIRPCIVYHSIGEAKNLKYCKASISTVFILYWTRLTRNDQFRDFADVVITLNLTWIEVEIFAWVWFAKITKIFPLER